VNPVDAMAFRGLMSQWATGVSVIASLGPEGPSGCTANAVTSVSLEPIQLLVCFDRRSDTLAAVRASGRFSINVLTAEQAPVSTRFASSEPPAAKFSGIAYQLEAGAPIIEGCLAAVICEVDRMLDGGDHEIVIGRPLAGHVQESGEPLIFFRNGYGRHQPIPLVAS
jgi:flavin reductase (DIM6/NTAB) family NADH-FMN oxidoreductase RutF